MFHIRQVVRVLCISLPILAVLVSSAIAAEPKLTVEKVDEDTVLVKEGFLYQNNVESSSPPRLTVHGFKDGHLLASGTSLMTLNGVNLAYSVGATWTFDKADITFPNGDYEYTSKREGATIEFRKDGVLLKGFTYKKSAQVAATQSTSETRPDNKAQTPSTDVATAPAAKPGVLSRIVAQPGTFRDKNPPSFSLSAVAASDMPEHFEFKIYGMLNWPEDKDVPKATPYGVEDKMRIIAEGNFCIKAPPDMKGGGFRCTGKFEVDKTLTPLAGIWDGMKEGATHTIIGKLEMFDYQFDSDDKSPLKFKVTKDGYSYVSGQGTVKDLRTHETQTFGK